MEINAFRLIGNVSLNGKMRFYRLLPIWGTLFKKRFHPLRLS